LLLSFVILVALLSFAVNGLSVLESGASASSTAAYAMVRTDAPADLYARAFMASLTDTTNATDSGYKTKAEASVTASQLYGKATNSLAFAYVGDYMVAWDQWPD